MQLSFGYRRVEDLKAEDDNHEIVYNGSEMKAIQTMMNKSAMVRGNQAGASDGSDDEDTK